MVTARRWSLYVALSVNAIIVVVDLALFASAVRQGATTAAIPLAAASGGFAIVIWWIVAAERRLQLQIATAESYFAEQRADTLIKEAMVESIKRHGAVVGFDGPLMTKARPN